MDKMASILINIPIKNYEYQKTFIGIIQALNGNSKEKWQQINDILWTLSKNYNFARINLYLSGSDYSQGYKRYNSYIW